MFNLRRKHPSLTVGSGEMAIRQPVESPSSVVPKAGIRGLAQHVMLEAGREASRVLLGCHELTANDVKEGFAVYEDYVNAASGELRIRDFVEVLGNGNAEQLVSILSSQRGLHCWPFVVTPPHDYYRRHGADLAPLLRLTGCMVLCVERNTWNVMTVGGCNPFTVSECAKAITALRRQTGQPLPFVSAAALSLEIWKAELDKHFGGTS
jgi:hypothetical protein